MTPAHKRAMTKTLLGLIAMFGVWLAPPEPPRPLLARQRAEHARHPAPWPAITPPALSATLLGLSRRPAVRATGPQPSREGWNKTTCGCVKLALSCANVALGRLAWHSLALLPRCQKCHSNEQLETVSVARWDGTT